MDEIQVARDGTSTVERQVDVVCAPANDREMPCPMCGAAMPDLKGGKASICPNCGFKDSCCY